METSTGRMGGSGRKEVNTIPKAVRLSPLIQTGF
jgi:hypothetical protein